MPTTAAEVGHFVKTTPGGGHTAWRGAANIDSGLAVDMRLMNQTVLSEDGKMAGLGFGGSLHDAYHQLSPHNLTVMGGRIVLASGKVTYVTRASHPDFWLALKGGTNNFGIITRFDVPTLACDLMRAFQLDWSFHNAPADVYLEVIQLAGLFGEFLLQPQSGRTDYDVRLLTATYGDARDDHARVRAAVAGIVDPQGVFQKRVPGGFKVFK
ncbi:FAD-binding oxidoreductase [Apiospora phragmitis]|uniref:FAD-binding oxidoreductase n=1 Tax=Apiospora phragmitis TaxID=2905665 RepID=A0ABR1USG7_9PEZI